MNDNLLERYEEVESLRVLPALEALYLERNPLALALTADQQRHLAATSNAVQARKLLDDAINKGAQQRADYRRKLELALPALKELDSLPTRNAGGT